MQLYSVSSLSTVVTHPASHEQAGLLRNLITVHQEVKNLAAVTPQVVKLFE